MLGRKGALKNSEGGGFRGSGEEEEMLRGERRWGGAAGPGIPNQALSLASPVGKIWDFAEDGVDGKEGGRALRV